MKHKKEPTIMIKFCIKALVFFILVAKNAYSQNGIKQNKSLCENISKDESNRAKKVNLCQGIVIALEHFDCPDSYFPKKEDKVKKNACKEFLMSMKDKNGGSVQYGLDRAACMINTSLLINNKKVKIDLKNPITVDQLYCIGSEYIQFAFNSVIQNKTLSPHLIKVFILKRIQDNNQNENSDSTEACNINVNFKDYSSFLWDIPNEISFKILDYLSLKDLKLFSSVNKMAYDITFEIIASRFSAIGFSRSDLEELIKNDPKILGKIIQEAVNLNVIFPELFAGNALFGHIQN